MAVFIIFVVVAVLSYLILWTPFVSKLNRDVSIIKLLNLFLYVDLANKNDADYNSDLNNTEDTKDTRVPQ